MTDFTYYQSNFTAGELSPRISGYIDFQKFSNGLELQENFINLQQGGITRRPGTYFAAEVKDSTKPVRLIPFAFNTGQAYIVEIGDGYMRFYDNGGQIASGGSPYEISGPYSSADVHKLSWTQSADVLYITHPDYAVRKLQRTAATSWTLTTLDFQDGPYLDINTTTTTLTPSGASGSVTVTASAALFAATDVGRQIRIDNGTNWAWGKITAYTSATQVTVGVKSSQSFPTTATTNWRLGAFSDTTGHPYVATFYQQRLAFGGNNNNPQGLWFSKSGEYETFSPTEPDATVKDSDGLSFTIATDEVNAVRWLIAEDDLSIGTAGGEYKLSPTSNATLSPTSVQVKRQTKLGSAPYLRPVMVNHAILFTQRAALKLQQWTYDWRVNGFSASDLTLLADHITQGGIVDMAFQYQPNNVLWCVRSDGTLLSVTYNAGQTEWGWGRHFVGGTFGTGHAEVENVAVIPSTDHDQVWLCVKRTINGLTKRYIEYLTPEFKFKTLPEAFFTDCGLTYDGTATTTITGLDHLEGETVQVLADGAVHPEVTVASGAVTLNYAASKVHIGYNSPAKMRTLQITARGQIQGKAQRISHAYIHFLETVGADYGYNESDREPLVFPNTTLGQPPGLFTGSKRVPLTNGYDTDSKVFIGQYQPLPMTVLSLMSDVHAGAA